MNKNESSNRLWVLETAIRYKIDKPKEWAKQVKRWLDAKQWIEPAQTSVRLAASDEKSNSPDSLLYRAQSYYDFLTGEDLK